MRRDNVVGAGVLIVLVLLLVAALVRNGRDSPPDEPGPASGDSPNANVVSWVRRDDADKPWMKHVTRWDAGDVIRVYTDYPSDRESSWRAAYEICTAVKGAYVDDATDLPRLRVYGIDPNLSIKVDGSRDREPREAWLAMSTGRHDYACGITPSKDYRDEARKLGVPVYLY